MEEYRAPEHPHLMPEDRVLELELRNAPSSVSTRTRRRARNRRGIARHEDAARVDHAVNRVMAPHSLEDVGGVDLAFDVIGGDIQSGLQA